MAVTRKSRLHPRWDSNHTRCGYSKLSYKWQLIIIKLAVNRQIIAIITVRNSSCKEVMFSQGCVKNSVHRGDVCVSHAHCPPRHTCPPSMHAPWAYMPPATHAPLDMHTPQPHMPPWVHMAPSPACMPPTDTTRCSQWAGGTHPTGMHSCSTYEKWDSAHVRWLYARWDLVHVR